MGRTIISAAAIASAARAALTARRRPSGSFCRRNGNFRSSANRIAIAMIPSGTDALNGEAAIPNGLPSRCRAPDRRQLAVRGHAVAGIDAVEHRIDRNAKAFPEARVSTHRGLAGPIEVARERNLD